MEKSACSLLDSPLFDKPLSVLFVCTGNTCRSPMAEALFNDMARIPPICTMCDMQRTLGMRKMRASSAGLYTGGEPIAENAVRALEEEGVRSLPDNDYKSHKARQLDAEMMENCDVAVGITGSHAMQMMASYPQYASKITCLPSDIADPYGGDIARYRECFAALKKGIEQMFFESEGT